MTSNDPNNELVIRANFDLRDREREEKGRDKNDTRDDESSKEEGRKKKWLK